MDDLSHLAAEAAQAGGWAAHAHYRSGALRVRSKGGPALNVVTEADLASQNAIVALLRARRPDDAIWAEEDLRTTGTTGVTWLVDPLDSTASFSRGLPGWSASVGAWHDGRPVAGAVFDPICDDLLMTGQEYPTVGQPAVELIGAIALLIVHHTHPAAGVSAGEWFLRAGRLRATGSPAIGLAHTALGRYDCILIDATVQPWDVAAGLALCQQTRRVIVMEYTTHPRILVCGEARGRVPRAGRPSRPRRRAPMVVSAGGHPPSGGVEFRA